MSFAGKMSERGKEGRKKIFPAGTARALGWARLPVENIFFHIRCFSEARIFPLAGKSAFFPAEYLAQHCLAGKSALFPGRSCHKVQFPLDRLWFFARLSTQRGVSLDRRLLFARLSIQSPPPMDARFVFASLSTERPFLVDRLSV